MLQCCHCDLEIQLWFCSPLWDFMVHGNGTTNTKCVSGKWKQRSIFTLKQQACLQFPALTKTKCAAASSYILKETLKGCNARDLKFKPKQHAQLIDPQIKGRNQALMQAMGLTLRQVEDLKNIKSWVKDVNQSNNNRKQK